MCETVTGSGSDRARAALSAHTGEITMQHAEVRRRKGSRAGTGGLSWTALAVLIALAPVPAARADDRIAFMQELDFEEVRLVAVQHDGRFKTFDTLAREIVQFITGSAIYQREIEDDDGRVTTVQQDPVFTYLDLMFNGHDYAHRRVVRIKRRPIRESLVQAAGEAISEAEARRIQRDGLVSIHFLLLPGVQTRIEELSRDLITTSKEIDSLFSATNLLDPGRLGDLLRVIPPPDATSPYERWYPVSFLRSTAPRDAAHAGLRGTFQPIPGMDRAEQQALADQWEMIANAWAAADAEAANGALHTFAMQLAQINTHPEIYPPHRKLAMEHWYYTWNKMTGVWWFYLLAIVLLLMGVVYRWRGWFLAGVGVFGLAFALHTVATGIRWYLAGRIPNSNMFEAITAAAWFGCVMAMFIELGPKLTRKRFAWIAAWGVTVGSTLVFAGSLLSRGVMFHAWREWGPVPTASLIAFSAGLMALVALTVGRRFTVHGLPLLGAAAGGMASLMCGHFMPVTLNSDIGTRMPILNDVWLYIHVNVTIASYALIGMAFVTAAMYMIGRLLTRPTTGLWLSMLIPAAVIPLFSLFPAIDLHMVMSAWMPFLIVLAGWILCAMIGAVWRWGADRAFDVWQGAPMMATMVPAGGFTPPTPEPPGPEKKNGDPIKRVGLAKVLDGATMLLIELSFIMLWTGIVMGAVWADHSWGRPWGWDPKEVFAVNTWIIFLILVHVRLKVKDKEAWTAVLAVIGCSVMLFNWVVVNFFIVGLHSYA